MGDTAGSTAARRGSPGANEDPIDAVPIDGRRLRGERSREAVVEAMLELIRDGDRHPSAAAIVERVGVSVRSVFRHFDDLDSLYGLAVERQIDRIVPLLDLGTVPADLEARIAVLVAQRARLFEDISPVRHVGEELRARSPLLRRHLEATQRWMREQSLSLFAAELADLPEPDQRDVGDAIDAATSWRMWVSLREDQGRSVVRARSIIERLLVSLLG